MITVTIPNLSKVIKELDDYKKELAEKKKQLLERLAEEGIALIESAPIQYDGAYSISTGYEETEDGIAFYAEGEKIAFIEFGTGTYYTDIHEKAGDLGIERGTYGKGKGANPPWHYTNEETGETRQSSYGNPPNRIVYNAGKELREKVEAIAKEVYG